MTAANPVEPQLSEEHPVKRMTGWRMVLMCIFQMALVIIAYEFVISWIHKDFPPAVTWLLRVLLVVLSGLVVAAGIRRIQHRRLKAEQRLADTMTALREALAQVKQLKQLLSICASCRKVRDDDGAWYDLDKYISDHLDTRFTHGLCDTCIQKHYPDMWEGIKAKREQEVHK